MTTKPLYKIYRYWIMLNPDPKPWSYVGRTSLSLKNRAGGLTGKKYIEDCSRFGAAIEAYGWPNFQFEVIEDGLTKAEAHKREQYWIDYYNSVEHGWNTLSGLRNSDENFKTHFTQDHKEKIRQALKGRRPCEALITLHSKPVIQYNLAGEEIQRFKSASEAARFTGIAQSSITSVANHKYGRKTAGNCYWEYANTN